MQAGAPGLACSKEFSSGSISSQPASRRVVGRGGAAEKSGAMNGLASWAATADLGATRRSGARGAGLGLGGLLGVRLDTGLALHLAHDRRGSRR